MTAVTELRPGGQDTTTMTLVPLLMAMGSATAVCTRWGEVLGMAPALEQRVLTMQPRARTAWFASLRTRITAWDRGSREWHGEHLGWRVHLYQVDLPSAGAVVARFELPRATALPLRLRAILTPREADVALGILEGLDSRSIAARLGVTVHTVRRMTERLFTKLGIHKRAQLTQRALGICGEVERP